MGVGKKKRGVNEKIHNKKTIKIALTGQSSSFSWRCIYKQVKK